MRALGAARTPKAQGRAAAAVAGAYGSAARRFAAIDVTPLEAEAHPAIVGAVRSAREAWTKLARTASRSRRAAYARQRKAVRRADDAVASALARLRALGYRIG
jgi:hypothetical protein